MALGWVITWWLSVGALASPTVDPVLVEALPPEVRQDLADQQGRLQELEARAAEARHAIGFATDLAIQENVDLQRINLRLEQARAEEEQATTAVDAAESRLTDALASLDSAKQDVKDLKARVRIARSDGNPVAEQVAAEALEDARARRSAARAEVPAARDDLRLALSSEGNQKSGVDDRLSQLAATRQVEWREAWAADAAIDLAEHRVRLMEAERDLARAELELARARAVAAAGKRVEIGEFEAEVTRRRQRMEFLLAAVEALAPTTPSSAETPQ
jgi:chromosome segregation ATPase